MAHFFLVFYTFSQYLCILCFLLDSSLLYFRRESLVAKAEEEAGLDISEHGEEAYSERTGSPLLN